MSIFKKATKNATNTAIDTVKETLNDKLETYSGIIKIGLTLGVIIFGTKKINQHTKSHEQPVGPPQYQYPQQPIVINNYYDRGYIPNGQRQNRQQHQNRR